MSSWGESGNKSTWPDKFQNKQPTEIEANLDAYKVSRNDITNTSPASRGFFMPEAK